MRADKTDRSFAASIYFAAGRDKLPMIFNRP
jgi:hypothetical protein